MFFLNPYLGGVKPPFNLIKNDNTKNYTKKFGDPNKYKDMVIFDVPP